MIASFISIMIVVGAGLIGKTLNQFFTDLLAPWL
jgi:Flp pilus assembly pilin Flp